MKILTKNKKFLYYKIESSTSQERAFRTAFRRYKNYYLSSLKEVLPANPPGYEELGNCTFYNPIDQEAHGELAHILDLENSTLYRSKTYPQKVELVPVYQAHHFFLRAVRKFYHSRLVQKNPSYLNCYERYNELNLENQIPLTPELRREWSKLFQLSPTEPLLTYEFLEAYFQKAPGYTSPTYNVILPRRKKTKYR